MVVANMLWTQMWNKVGKKYPFNTKKSADKNEDFWKLKVFHVFLAN